MIEGAPNGILGLTTQSGWMNPELFPKILDHVIEHMGVSVTKRGVLIMEKHEIHISVEVVEMAREKGLSIVYCHVLPPPLLQSSNAALRCRSIWAL